MNVVQQPGRLLRAGKRRLAHQREGKPMGTTGGKASNRRCRPCGTRRTPTTALRGAPWALVQAPLPAFRAAWTLPPEIREQTAQTAKVPVLPLLSGLPLFEGATCTSALLPTWALEFPTAGSSQGRRAARGARDVTSRRRCYVTRPWLSADDPAQLVSPEPEVQRNEQRSADGNTGCLNGGQPSGKATSRVRESSRPNAANLLQGSLSGHIHA